MKKTVLIADRNNIFLPKHKELIIHDNYVRKTIGKLNTKKLKNKKSNSSYQKKIENILEQRRNKLNMS